MRSLKPKILLYLLALWTGLAGVSALGYMRLKAVHSASSELINGVYPSAAAALEVESAIHKAYQNTIIYCSYLQTDAKTETELALEKADLALNTYFSVSQNTPPEAFAELRALLDDAKTHALDCLRATDEGMTPAEFQQHIGMLNDVQVRVVLALREAATREQHNMLAGTQHIDDVVAGGLTIFLGGSLFLLLGALAIGYRMSHTLLTPITALTRAAERFSEKDLSVRVNGVFPGEFGILARAFNAMANRIGHALEENTRLLSDVRESQTRFQDLYDNAPDGYHSLGPHGTIIEMNNTELQWLQYDRDQVIGHLKLTDIIAASSIPTFKKAFDELKRTGKVVDVEFDFKRADGTTFPGRVNSTAFYDDSGRFLHSRSSVRDISREKELHKQLLQSQKLESLGTLSGGIAHDFNNLLTSIMGFSQLAMLEQDPKSKTYQNLDRVVKLGDQAAGLTRQLLTFSRKTPMEKHAISPVPLVKETLKVLERTLPETIRIITDIQRDTANIEADATQIQQVLMNLCVNARDAMPDGGTLSISLKNEMLDENLARQHGNRPAGPYVCLEIKDTGMGMPPDVQEHIFEPFFTTKEVGKGTGLGLSIVHGIVESHGGHIRLSSQPGKGTAFHIFIPAVDTETGQAEHDASLSTSGSETILLVEDDPNVIETTHQMLSSRGYTVLTATDGKRGLETYLQHQDDIDIIISDLVMPEMSGIDMSLEIERVAPEATVLLISGYTDRDLDSECKIIAGFLQKPFELNTLCAAVRQALDQRPVLA